MVLLVVDPNVFVSGLIAQGPPAEVVDLVRYGELRAAGCPRLLAELEGVLRRPRFRRYVEMDEVDAYLGMLRSVMGLEPDPLGVADIECRDPNDAYLIALGRQTGADALVSGDGDLTELDDPRPVVLKPAEVLERWDPVPRRVLQAAPGAFQVVLSGPKSAERRVHRGLQAAGFVTQRTSRSQDRSGTGEAWVEVLCRGGDHPLASQREALDRVEALGARDGYRLRQHGVVAGGAPQVRVVRHRTGREELFRFTAADPAPVLEGLARQFGLPVEDLVLEDLFTGSDSPEGL